MQRREGETRSSSVASSAEDAQSDACVLVPSLGMFSGAEPGGCLFLLSPTSSLRALHPSLPLRMLRAGAVGFAVAVRRCTAPLRLGEGKPNGCSAAERL